ncbi:glycosyltransferase family 2 protein [Flavobacteriaceae bacterium 14752]|uniref:glycosyltransferase family 2 protein n=1 Tax=Mesohalobacter salilacus TaxID=2491711 RepID=UPI000F64077E|nr:glycosyltransferase family 2 protein [Flavobacteriaceae bacterium 14752]
MISILIPCYNYPTYDLVNILYKQCIDLKISFEILVSEDGGKKYLDENRKINSLNNCVYIENKNNLGRVLNKNLLLKQSKFNLKLLLDSDVIPSSENFIKIYLDFSKEFKTFACFGGLSYNKTKSSKKSLRFNYGIKRECKKASVRLKKPYKLFLTSNTLLKNCEQTFEEKITNYGFEEVVFADKLKRKNIDVLHINNSVIHKNLETNEVFIKKIEEGLRTLISLEKQNIVSKGKNQVSKVYHLASKLFLSKLLSWFFERLKNPILRILIYKGKPIWLLDIYRILYFSKNY